MNEINVRIKLANEQTLVGSQWLRGLRSELQRELEVPCSLETIDSPEHTMDGGMMAAIAIASLSLNALYVLLEIIRFRREQSGRGSVTITGDGISATKSNLTDDEVVEVIRRIQESKSKQITITVENE